MFEWIRKLRKTAAPTRKLRTRDDGEQTVKVELAEFAPSMLAFLGLTSYLQLELYEAATRGVSGAPSLRAKDVLAGVAGQTLSKHQRLSEELRRRGHESYVVMEPFSPVIDRFIERLEVSDWHQHVLSLYLVGGLFDDFFASLAAGLKDPFRDEVSRLLREQTGSQELKALLESEIAEDPQLADRLALWGRRLVGDTLLVSRAVLSLSAGRPFVASEVEPVFTELIADHIRRMDGLGLTA